MTGLFPGLPRFTTLCAVLLLFVFPPGDAQAQTCYAVDDGDWTDVAVWSDADDGTGGDCPASGGIPDQAGESAIITDGILVSLDADIGPIDELTIGAAFALLEAAATVTLDVDGPRHD